jgi:hypothetical protein
MTSSPRSCHHAACTWLRWLPGPLNQAYLSSPHLEASPTLTFRACSSPAPTPVKPQPAPAVLSQESVHTTLSITHHTRKRPTTGPQTTQALILPLDEYIYNTHVLVTKEKRKRKETTKTKSNKRSKAKGKAKGKITWRRQVSDPLGRVMTRHIRDENTLKQRAQTTKPKLEITKSSPWTHASSPWTNATPLGRMHAKHIAKQSICFSLALTDQTGQPYRSDRCARLPSTWELTPVRLVHFTGQADDDLDKIGNDMSSKLARNHLETF